MAVGTHDFPLNLPKARPSVVRQAHHERTPDLAINAMVKVHLQVLLGKKARFDSDTVADSPAYDTGALAVRGARRKGALTSCM